MSPSSSAEDASAGSQCQIAGETLADVWRELVGRGLEVALPLRGQSMVPSLVHGDTIHVVACAERPAVGAVVVALTQPAFAHRVLAAGRRHGRCLVVTAGDRFPHRPDGVHDGSLILGEVTAFTRDGTRHAVQRIRPRAFPRLKAWWLLATHERAGWFAKALVMAREALKGPAKRAVRRAHGMQAAARGWPLIGPVARAIWPDLGDRCEIVVSGYGAETAHARDVALFAVWRGVVVGKVALMVARDDESQLWLEGAYTKHKYRRRGIAGRLHREAMRTAREMGFRELFGWVRLNNLPERDLLKRLGWRAVTEGPFADTARALNANYPDHEHYGVLVADLSQIEAGDNPR